MTENREYMGKASSTEEAGWEGSREKHGTVFDDVFRTMAQKMPQLLIPLINEVFQTDYSDEEAFEQYRNEHEEVFGKVITDSIIIIRDKTYHIECQSVDDTTMAIRMVEYDFAIALEQSVKSSRMYEMDFPESCVLYLRSTRNTPDVLQVKVNLPGGESFVYKARTIKLSRYTRNDIFRKHLLLLLPYYVLRYEKDAELYESDKEKLQELLSDYEEIRKQLETELLGEEKSVLYADMIDLIIQISDHIFAGSETVRKGVEETMGGKVLKLKSERLREEGWREGKEQGLAEGKEQGLAEGKEQGLAEGKEQGLAEGKAEGIEFQTLASIKKLMKNGGMSLEQAMRILEIPIEEQGIYEEKLNY